MKKHILKSILALCILTLSSNAWATDFVSDGNTYFYLENYSPTSGWGDAMWIDEDCPYAWLHVWNDTENKDTEAFEQISGNHYRVKVPAGTWKHFQLYRGAALHTTSNNTGNIDFSSGKNWLLTYGTASGWTDATWALNREYDGTEKLFIQNYTPAGWGSPWSTSSSFRLYVYLDGGTSDAVWCDAVVESSEDYSNSTVYSVTPPAGCYKQLKLAGNNKKSFTDGSDGRYYTGYIQLDPTKNYISGNYTQNGTGGNWGTFTLDPITSDGTKKLYFNMNPTSIDWDWKVTHSTGGDGNFAYFFGSGGANDWSAHSVQVTGDYYYIVVPEGTWNGWILTRNSVTSNPSWSNKYSDNQTGDIFFRANKNYMSDFAKGSPTATWGQYAPTPSIILNQGEPDAYIMSLSAGTTYTKDMSFEGHSTYEIQILDGVTVYGLDNNIWTSSTSNYSLYSGQYQVRIATAGAGTYTITYNKTGNVLSAAYPSVTHPSMDYCYLIDYSGATGSAGSSWSGGSYIHAWNSASGVAQTLSPGTQMHNKVKLGTYNYFYFAPGDYGSVLLSENGDETDRYQENTISNGYGKYASYVSSWAWRAFGGFTVTLNHNEATTYPANPTVEFNGTAPSNITPPTKTGYVFGGYWSNSTLDGLMIIAPSGAWVADQEGYTDADGKWIHEGGTATLMLNGTRTRVYGASRRTSLSVHRMEETI